MSKKNDTYWREMLIGISIMLIGFCLFSGYVISSAVSPILAVFTASPLLYFLAKWINNLSNKLESKPRDKPKLSPLNSRLDYISAFKFPESVWINVLKSFPEINEKFRSTIEGHLKSYFEGCARQPGHEVAIPSIVVAAAYQGFTQAEEEYALFCDYAFGDLLCPPHVSQSSSIRSVEEYRSWAFFCLADMISPSEANALPKIYELDSVTIGEAGQLYSAEHMVSRYKMRRQGDTSFTSRQPTNPNRTSDEFGGSTPDTSPSTALVAALSLSTESGDISSCESPGDAGSCEVSDGCF